MTTMKTEIKALPLSLTLSLLALIGACSSVNSTPRTDVPSEENSVIIEGAESEDKASEDILAEDMTEEPETMGEMTEEPETMDGMTEEPETMDGMTEETETTDEMMLPEGDTEELGTEVEPEEGVYELKTQPE